MQSEMLIFFLDCKKKISYHVFFEFLSFKFLLTLLVSVAWNIIIKVQWINVLQMPVNWIRNVSRVSTLSFSITICFLFFIVWKCVKNIFWAQYYLISLEVKIKH